VIVEVIEFPGFAGYAAPPLTGFRISGSCALQVAANQTIRPATITLAERIAPRQRSCHPFAARSAASSTTAEASLAPRSTIRRVGRCSYRRKS
jgi:hypothetical protein